MECDEKSSLFLVTGINEVVVDPFLQSGDVECYFPNIKLVSPSPSINSLTYGVVLKKMSSGKQGEIVSFFSGQLRHCKHSALSQEEANYSILLSTLLDVSSEDDSDIFLIANKKSVSANVNDSHGHFKCQKQEYVELATIREYIDLPLLSRTVGFLSSFMLPITFIQNITSKDDDIELMANYHTISTQGFHNSQDDFNYSQANPDDSDYEDSQATSQQTTKETESECEEASDESEEEENNPDIKPNLSKEDMEIELEKTVQRRITRDEKCFAKWSNFKDPELSPDPQ
jgi:hypothetical protein